MTKRTLSPEHIAKMVAGRNRQREIRNKRQVAGDPRVVDLLTKILTELRRISCGDRLGRAETATSTAPAPKRLDAWWKDADLAGVIGEMRRRLDALEAHSWPVRPVVSDHPLYGPAAAERLVPRHVVPAPSSAASIEALNGAPDDSKVTDSIASAMTAELAEYDAEDEAIATTPIEKSPQELWEPRLQMWRQARMWLGEWGGRPGQADCIVPEEILRQHGIVQ